MAIDLDAEIDAARQKLAELDRLREIAAARLTELGALRGSGSTDSAGSKELPAASKLRLFRDLFRGREDVFAVRWENHGRSRSGYSPRCANEWQRGVCGKPKVRCGECANQAFAALDDRQMLAHLQGRHVVGIYPLLPDDRCWLLAIDLDRGSWRADVQALTQTCRSVGLHPAIERSRSGSGAHIWFFFTDPVPAAEARRLGFTILTATMATVRCSLSIPMVGCSRARTSYRAADSGTSLRYLYNVRPATPVTSNSSMTGSSPIAISGPTSPRSPRSRRTA
jgi:hypothetical protein